MISSKTMRFGSLLEAVPDALVGMDQEGVIRFVNRQSESLFGYDRDELVGQPIETLLPESLWQIYAEHKEHYFTDPRTRSSSLELVLTGVRKDGTELPVNISLSHIDTGDVLLVVTAVRDVTRQQDAVQTAERIAAVVEYSNDAIIGSTLEGAVTSWNPAATRIYGYSSQDILGRSVSVLAPQGREGEFFANLASVRGGKAVEHFETERRRKDGAVFPVSITIAPIRDEDGVIVGASAVHRDVTGQRRAFEVAQRMAAMVEYSAEAIASWTLEGIITSWNPAAMRLYGYSSEEVVGQPVSTLLPPDRLGEAENILEQIRAGRSVVNFETVRLRKDGTEVPAVLTVSPISDVAGKVVAADAIVREVTEKEHSARYARTLIEAALDPMVTISPQGKINDVNEAAIKLTGVPRDRLIGSDCAQYLTEPEKAIAFFQQVFERGSLAGCPLTVRHVDGTLINIVCNASLYKDIGGKVLGVFAAGHDVTGLAQALTAAQRLAAIVENSNDAIFSVNLEGIVTSWNAAATRMYGYASDEIVGKPTKLLIPQDRRGEVDAYLAAIRADEYFERLETLRVRKDGTELPVSVTVSPIRDQEGAVIGTSVIHRDMTRQREAFEAAERMAAIVEYSGDAIVGTSLDGLVTSWNPAAERLFGYSTAKIVGRSVDLLAPGDRKGEIISVLTRIRAGRPVGDLDTVCLRKDRMTFPVRLSVAPVHGPDGSIVGASCMARDITAQKEAVASTRRMAGIELSPDTMTAGASSTPGDIRAGEASQSARRMAAIVESSADPIIGQTLEGIITIWNPAAERLYGYSRQEIIGQPVELLSPDGLTGEIESILARIKAGRPVAHHKTLRVRKDGTEIRVSFTVSPIRSADGAIIGASVIHDDIAEPG